MAVTKKKDGLKKRSDRATVPFRGGCYTDTEKALLEVGRYSMVQNMRSNHPGYEQRKGCARGHTTQDISTINTAPTGWLSDWQKRIEITIADTNVDTNLTNFPMLVYLSTSSGSGTDDVSAVFDELTSNDNRKKIAVTTSDGSTQCYVEIERWDHANEKAWLWVKVPSILATGGATLYIYYDSTKDDNTTYVGDPESTPGQAVWDANFVAVYHMGNDPNGDAADSVKDSTDNDNHGTPDGSMTTADLVDGKIGKALDFEGTDDTVVSKANTGISGNATLTLEATFWRDTTVNAALVGIGVNDTAKACLLFYDLTGDGSLNVVYTGDKTISTADGVIADSEWNSIAVTKAAGAINTTTIFYKNGGVIAATGTPPTDVPNITDSPIYIGEFITEGSYFPNGKIDEVRVSNIVRTPAWLKATYYSNFDTLASYGSAEDYDDESIVEGEDPNKVLNLYQFSKGKIADRYFFAQMSDGDLLQATNAPPAVTSGAFGAEVHSGSAGQKAAAFSHLNDIMIYSNGVDQHQLFPGDGNKVDAFRVYAGTAAEIMPTLGKDFTLEVTDGDSTTVAVLDSLSTWANYDCLYIMTPVPANKLTFTITAANANASVATVNYWKNDDSWADTSDTDGTISPAGKTLGASGSFTWTHPTDEIPTLKFEKVGYWYQIIFSAALDAEVEISEVTYGGGFRPLQNAWNGISDYLVEAQVALSSDANRYTYPSNAIDISSLTTSDPIFLSSYDKLKGFYVDVGDTPNTATTTTIAAGDVEYWNGLAWTSVGTPFDGTLGLTRSGYILWDIMADDTKKFNPSARYTAYWYRLNITTANITGDPIIAISGVPYFEMETFGKGGTSTVRKDRGCYTFNKYPQYIYVSHKDRINVLNGDDFAILEAGDGRANAITCMKKFHNELMVWQEEKGKEGGCLTLFEGYSPQTFGKLVLSAKVGTFNNKSAVVVDGVLTATATDETLKTLAFFISHYGICMTDGRTVTVISDDIANYFDPNDTTNCIRRGYESEMWVEHDTSCNVLRFGLVTGASATVCNTFPVYDLVDKGWSFDVLGQALTCMTEVEAASGNLPILQYGGGTDDGAIYRLNTGTNDIDIANTTIPIDAYIRMELGIEGVILLLRHLILRMKSQTAGDCTVTPYRNNVAGSDTLTLSMIAENTSEAARRHRVGMDVQGQQMSLKFQNNVASQELYLLDAGFEIWEKEGH